VGHLREHTEEWKQLCQQAAVEQDPKKLLELTKRINELLDTKQHRIENPQKASDSGK
jgi:hypothetical protein